MKKIIFVSIILFITTINSAQKNYSLEFNYGLISPLTRSNGLQDIGKINYSFNDNIKFYTAIGYGVWGTQKVHFKKKSGKYNTLVASDNHKLTPLYFGASFLLKGSKFLDLYAITEIGLSYFSYRQYNYDNFINPQTNEREYIPSSNSNSSISDYLLGIGIGIGGGHKVSENTELLLQIKINTNYSANTKRMFDTNVTYTSLTLGFNYFI